MAEGVRTGRIDTVRPEHTPEAMGRPPRADDHGGEVYVYRRTGQPCLVCGARGPDRGAGRDATCSGVRDVSPGSAPAPYSDRADEPSSEDRVRARVGATRRALRDCAARARLPREPRRSACVILVLLSLAIGACSGAFPDDAPLTLLILPMLLGSLILGPRHLPWFVVFLLGARRAALTRQDEITAAHGRRRRACCSSPGFIILLTSFRRTRLGVAGAQGESMLVDLRDRIQSQGSIPGPARRAGTPRRALRSAGGYAVRRRLRGHGRPPDTDRLEVVVVDVSGKGEGAGTRALLLAGALRRPARRAAAREFLPAANEFLLRQDWEEGFATAVHLSLDLRTGELRGPQRRPPAGRPAGRRLRPLGPCSPSEGPALGPARRAPSSPASTASCGPATR